MNNVKNKKFIRAEKDGSSQFKMVWVGWAVVGSGGDWPGHNQVTVVVGWLCVELVSVSVVREFVVGVFGECET
jgi:hypothetical protein